MTRLREIVVEWMLGAVKSSPELGAYLNFPALIEAHGKGEDRILRNAPLLIVAHAPVDLLPAQISTVLALEYSERSQKYRRQSA
jgi:hypothetical protein